MSHHLTFGVDRDPGVISKHAPKKVPLSAQPNPCVVAYGPGPAGETCHDCAHLVLKHRGDSRSYYGCEERGVLTHGSSTDHLVNWPACSHYRQEPP